MENNIRTLPLLPLKNSVLFPGLMMPLSVGRAASIGAVEKALSTEDKEIIVVAQRDPAFDSPGAEDLFTLGTRAVIKKVARPNAGQIDVLVLGIERVVIVKVDETEGFMTARVRALPMPDDSSRETEALTLSIVEMGSKFVGLIQNERHSAQELARMFTTHEDPLRLAYMVASIMNLEGTREQTLLEAPTRVEALRLVHGWLSHEVEVLNLRNKITEDARGEMSKEQRDYILRQQKRAIENELGEKNEQAETEDLREKLKKAVLPDDVRKEAERELGRLEKMNAAQPEYNVIRTWLEYVIELPWKTRSEDNLDIPRARQVLDEDHFGITKVKERILEQLAVLKLNPEAKAPILCFVGAPGVGKTSLGQSIARAIGRKFERMSLGGLHDEAELRGHRRTYIGAMPGRLIQAMRRAGANNPVLMLDEIDKLGRDFRGDPAAALLEVLDPEQNKTFRDNYLDLPFDLSKVLFITTANSLDTIPAPLLDRMEIIALSGYSEEEKAQIARRYLIPRQLTHTGLTPEQCNITEAALLKIISSYTREAGVRRLEQTLGRVIRKVALKFAEGVTTSVTVQPDDVVEMLGPEPITPEMARRELPPGVATGLAWTETGGDVLYIEASLQPNGKELTITGQLGAVMQESAKTARSFVWAHAAELGINPELFLNSGLHIHVPAGAIPKDGPSAGVTMATALASIYSGVPARQDTAMTGEITLTGLVLPIGGLKEKVLAARRAGLRRVIAPRGNQKDLRDLPEEVRNEMEFIFADRVEDVLKVMLPSLAYKPAKAA
ncbi:MAG TPA: endopeptidase La [Bryobacteraceae bacterium]|jgi:ATP-dependent Lon protease|nr:endopeptidase La [Bryobacteraceae bacterium]